MLWITFNCLSSNALRTSYFSFMQSGLLKRIEEKENERESFELEISKVDLGIDDRERNMVRMTLPSTCKQVTLSLC